MDQHDALCQHQTIRNGQSSWYAGYDDLTVTIFDLIEHDPIPLDERKESLRRRLEKAGC